MSNKYLIMCCACGHGHWGRIRFGQIQYKLIMVFHDRSHDDNAGGGGGEGGRIIIDHEDSCNSKFS